MDPPAREGRHAGLARYIASGNPKAAPQTKMGRVFAIAFVLVVAGAWHRRSSRRKSLG